MLTASQVEAAAGTSHSVQPDERVWALLQQALAHDDSGVAQSFLAHARALVGRESHLPARSAKSVSFRRRIDEYLESNLGARIHVDDLVSLTHLSTSHFHRVFRRRFGQPPMSYVMERRVRRAQTLMLAAKQPLIQISLDCGFCDQAHFSRTFRRVVGMTPREWRRKMELEMDDPSHERAHEQPYDRPHDRAHDRPPSSGEARSPLQDGVPAV